MTKDEALQVFRQTGALLEGHFILRSGLHSRQFFQCALALQQMPAVEKLGAALAARVRPLGAATVILEAFEPDKLPPDLAKIPAVKPGSK